MNGLTLMILTDVGLYNMIHVMISDYDKGG